MNAAPMDVRQKREGFERERENYNWEFRDLV